MLKLSSVEVNEVGGDCVLEVTEGGIVAVDCDGGCGSVASVAWNWIARRTSRARVVVFLCEEQVGEEEVCGTTCS